MPRRTHKVVPREEAEDRIGYKLAMNIPRELRSFLELEGKRLSTPEKRITPQKIVRALIVAYYEKRMAGLLIHPDD